MKNGRMQAKDVDDIPVLRFIHKVETEGVMPTSRDDAAADGERWHHVTWFSYEDGYVPSNSVRHAMPPHTPDKVVLAKMKRLIDRGLVDGCPCGCRGDYQLTDRGRAMIAVDQAAYRISESVKRIGELIAQQVVPAFRQAVEQMQRYAKTQRAASELVARWRAGDRRPTYVYGPALQLVPKAVLDELGATVDEFADHSVVTFDETQRKITLAAGSVGAVLAPWNLGELLQAAGVTETVVASGNARSGEATIIGVDWIDEMRCVVHAERPTLPAVAPVRRQPSYLQHDPTKRVTKRRRK